MEAHEQREERLKANVSRLEREKESIEREKRYNYPNTSREAGGG